MIIPQREWVEPAPIPVDEGQAVQTCRVDEDQHLEQLRRQAKEQRHKYKLRAALVGTGILLFGGLIYFLDNPNPAPPIITPSGYEQETQKQGPSMPSADLGRQVELEVWKWAKEKDTEESYRQYLNQFPQGQFATMARLGLEEKQRPPPSPPLGAPEPSTGISAAEVMAFIDQLLICLNSGSADDLEALYADQVDYFDRGFVPKSYILRDKAGYYKRWPSVQNRLISQPSLYTTGVPGEVTATFTTEFNVYNPSTRRGVTGTADNTFKIRRIGWQWYVVAEKQNILTRRNY